MGRYTQVGFALTRQKKGKLPELARFRYKIPLDVEATKQKAEEKGFIWRLHEGEPKNKRCKDGVGEHFPLPQYEITRGRLSPNAKIELAPYTTQIYLFGEELKPPEMGDGEAFLQNMEAFIKKMEAYCQQIETAEEVLNEIAVFSGDSAKFCGETRIYARTPAGYRLIINSRDITDHLLDNIEKAYLHEMDLAIAEMVGGNLNQARNRLELLLKELDFFAKSLIATARQMKDPRADKWEAEFRKLLQPPSYPMGFTQIQNSWFTLGQ
jgi:hypothetical protein